MVKKIWLIQKNEALFCPSIAILSREKCVDEKLNGECSNFNVDINQFSRKARIANFEIKPFNKIDQHSSSDNLMSKRKKVNNTNNNSNTTINKKHHAHWSCYDARRRTKCNSNIW